MPAGNALGHSCALGIDPVESVRTSSDDVLFGSPLAKSVRNLLLDPGDIGVPCDLFLVADTLDRKSVV